MAKLADAPDLGSGAERHSGSRPLGGTRAPPILMGGALVPSRFRSTDTPEGVPSVGLRTSSSRGGTTSGHGTRCKGMSTRSSLPLFCRSLLLPKKSLLRKSFSGTLYKPPFQWGRPGTFSLPLTTLRSDKARRATEKFLRIRGFFLASDGWTSDFVLARRYHVGTRHPLQRDEHSLIPSAFLPVPPSSQKIFAPQIFFGNPI